MEYINNNRKCGGSFDVLQGSYYGSSMDSVGLYPTMMPLNSLGITCMYFQSVLGHAFDQVTLPLALKGVKALM